MTGAEARGDHFSGVAASYAQFRPTYPEELFTWIASVAPRRDLVWECGAGSGQATGALSRMFARVVATDVSAAQVAQAPELPNVAWVVAPAECVPIAGRRVDVVCVGQALHWFRFDAFYDECRRVAAAGAILAAWTYGSPTMDGRVGAAVREFMYGAGGIGPYWPPERDHVTEEYQTIPFPFERIEAPRLVLEHEWPREQVIGYLRSMSATAQFAAKNGFDPVDGFADELRSLWPDEERRRITWPLITVAGRIR